MNILILKYRVLMLLPKMGEAGRSPDEGDYFCIKINPMDDIRLFARKLRKDQTDTEQIIWHILRNRRFYGLKFRRQVPMDKYVADFVCYEKKFIIELDGREHLDDSGLLKDRIRTEYLNGLGFRVVRFYNTDIFNHLENVLEFLYNELIL